MLIANKLIPAGAGLAAALLRRAATVELDWDTRQKSRFDTVDSAGRTSASSWRAAASFAAATCSSSKTVRSSS